MTYKLFLSSPDNNKYRAYTTINLASLSSFHGANVLLIDLSINTDIGGILSCSGSYQITQAGYLFTDVMPKLDFLPLYFNLEKRDPLLSLHLVLHQKIELPKTYDYIIIDCPQQSIGYLDFLLNLCDCHLIFFSLTDKPLSFFTSYLQAMLKIRHKNQSRCQQRIALSVTPQAKNIDKNFLSSLRKMLLPVVIPCDQEVRLFTPQNSYLTKSYTKLAFLLGIIPDSKQKYENLQHSFSKLKQHSESQNALVSNLLQDYEKQIDQIKKPEIDFKDFEKRIQNVHQQLQNLVQKFNQLEKNVAIKSNQQNLENNSSEQFNKVNDSLLLLQKTLTTQRQAIEDVIKDKDNKWQVLEEHLQTLENKVQDQQQLINTEQQITKKYIHTSTQTIENIQNEKLQIKNHIKKRLQTIYQELQQKD